MRRVLACLLLSASFAAAAQEGFPLDGTWRGERQTPNGPATVVMVLEWDGQQINGVMNPGPRAWTIKDGKLDPEGWKVTLVAENTTGQRMVFEGTIGDLGEYHRYLEGTWSEGGRSERVRIVRE